MQSNMFSHSVDTMSQTVRIPHIDSLRGTAVLLMVMVHAAATWNPFSQVQTSPLAYVISGLGGLAAPLFVTLFGWGVVRTHTSLSSRVVQCLFFFVAQIAVNLTSPHLFHTFTPGILSLMGVLTLLVPATYSAFEKHDIRVFSFFFAFTIVIQLLFSDIQGTGVWEDRTADNTLGIIISNLLFTGTYPVFPWFVFAFFGAMISRQKTASGRSLNLNTSTGMWIVFGLTYCTLTLVYSQMNQTLWAHPTEDALLTFFPANPSFLVAGITGVMLLWIAVQRFKFSFLASTGKMSLTIYLLHFMPLTLMRDYEVTHQWGLQISSVAVLLYTVIWVPVAGLWLYRWPKANVESLLRMIRKSLF